MHAVKKYVRYKKNMVAIKEYDHATRWDLHRQQ